MGTLLPDERLWAMARGIRMVLIALLVAACGAGPATLSPTILASPTARPTPPPSPSPLPDPVAGLGAALGAAGASVREVGTFEPSPLTGSGTILCVDGQEVRVYLFETAEEAGAVASQINPTDPSQVGTSMVSWAGAPRFWRADRMIVLYLGDSPSIELGLTSLLGDPFAKGEGRGPILTRHDC
jgi:hypothetical protein